MAPGGRQADDADARTKHTIVMPDSLWTRLRVAAIENHDDVSAILCRLAEDFLRGRKGGTR